MNFAVRHHRIKMPEDIQRHTDLPKALIKATISPRVNWNGIFAFLCSCVTVESGCIESPENRIFSAVPIPVICMKRTECNEIKIIFCYNLTQKLANKQKIIMI
jgi:hypothetical protein